MIATGIMCEMMLSNIPPQNFHFHLLHNEGGDAVLIKMWFPKQQRLDIYVDGMFIVRITSIHLTEGYLPLLFLLIPDKMDILI